MCGAPRSFAADGSGQNSVRRRSLAESLRNRLCTGRECVIKRTPHPLPFQCPEGLFDPICPWAFSTVDGGFRADSFGFPIFRLHDPAGGTDHCRDSIQTPLDEV